EHCASTITGHPVQGVILTLAIEQGLIESKGPNHSKAIWVINEWSSVGAHCVVGGMPVTTKIFAQPMRHFVHLVEAIV
ncbi:MAG: hypothetical protein ACYDHP_11820, partial [Ferrimicrobium sp.]